MVIFALFVPLLLGLFILSLIIKLTDKFNMWERIALAFPIGLGILTILIYLFALASIPLTLANILLAVSVVILSIGAYLAYKKRFCLSLNEFRSFKIPQLDWFEWLLVGVISLKVVYSFFIALIKPMVDVDAFQFYSIVAKGLYYGKSLFDPYLLGFIFDKPPFPFLAQGWILIGSLSANDYLLKIISPVLFLCLLVIFYSTLKREASRKTVLIFTFFLATLPFILHHTTTAYADFPVTFYFAAGAIYLYRSMKETIKGQSEQAFSLLLISAVCLAIAVWVKRGGLVLALISIFVYFIFAIINKNYLSKDGIKKAFLALIVFGLLTAPWLSQGKGGLFIDLFRLTVSQLISEPTASGIGGEAIPLPDMGTTLAIFGRKLFLYADWHLTMALFVITLLFFSRRAFSQPAVYLLSLVALAVFSVFMQFESTAMFRWLLDGTLLDRLIMNEIPLILFFCAEVVAPLFQAAKEKRLCPK